MQTRFLFQIRNSNKEKFLNNVYIYHLFKSEKRILISTSYQEYIGVNVEKKKSFKITIILITKISS